VQLPQVLQGVELVNLAPEELFQDPARDQAAAHAALRELALPLQHIDRALHPPPQGH
jgi:hypothetical protein